MIDREDAMTVDAFLTAVTQLPAPLPDSIVRQLEEIAKRLPESVSELHELAEQFEPLRQEYIAAICREPGEGDRLRFVETLSPVRWRSGDSGESPSVPTEESPSPSSSYVSPVTVLSPPTPATWEQVRQWLAEIIELAKHDALDILHSRVVEQEVLDLLDEP
jgi:hypothetical protein